MNEYEKYISRLIDRKYAHLYDVEAIEALLPSERTDTSHRTDNRQFLEKNDTLLF